MDLNQSKLTKTEWESTEIPIDSGEKEILKLIINGYDNVNIIYNKNESMINFLRLPPNENIMTHLYNIYFKPFIDRLVDKYDFTFDSTVKIKFQKVTSVEKLKLDNLSKTIDERGKRIFEYYMLHICECILKGFYKDNSDKMNKYYYTLHHLNNMKITNVNGKVKEFVESVLADYYVELNIDNMFKQSSDLIEHNDDLLAYKDYKLYEHQKELFTICRNPNPKLLLYIAPTGTGKTLSPLGLARDNKIIFVCAARHVGLALARSAVSMGTKVAFAFGCHDVSDIRLHYFAVKDYVKSDKTGKDIKYRDGKKKVDNTNGSNVEIMICDIKSYITAMHYMCAFNSDPSKLIMYWDEPTISMDYENHEFHDYISEIWKKNIIPNIILSSATLPHQHELQDTILDYQSRFEGSIVHSIISHDCNKSIPLTNSKNQIEMPHLKYDNFDDLQKCVTHCKEYSTLLRYFDLNEIVKFIYYMNANNKIENTRYSIQNQYEDISNLTMNNIKIHYLNILENITSESWDEIYNHFNSSRKVEYESNIYISTKDAYTLTDGPTIFLSNDVEKIAKFLLQTSKIPEQVITDMTGAIEYNDKLLKIITEKQKKLEDSMGDEVEKEHKMSKNVMKPEERKLKKEIDDLCKMVKTICLNELFIPNKLNHLRKWIQKDVVDREFSCDIQPQDVENIMLMNVNSTWKMLLLMGIGVFTNNHDPDYTEIMKQLAVNQKLYLIIASSDYIYGTNYQFCHGYISKDLNTMTQEKTIQALGRIGRNQLNKKYSIRFRDDILISKIFTTAEHKPEVENMNRLFNTPI